MTRQNNKLSLCGCCEGVEKLTPASVENRPALSELAYRVGTHARFKESMQTALSEHAGLRKITRDPADPTLALFDGWATVLDVLSFYQERIANEGFIRTAVERRSVLELARRIGYELAPGVAAETHLAFEMETAQGAPEKVTIAAGTQVQSVPGQDELPQTFETVEEIEARPEWNKLLPRTSVEQVLGNGATQLVLSGHDLTLRPGAALLVVDAASTAKQFVRASAVEVDADAKRTSVTLVEPLDDDFHDPVVHALRTRASFFGHNAPQAAAMPKELTDNGLIKNKKWVGFTVGDAEPLKEMNLDRVYPEVLEDGWIVLKAGNTQRIRRVQSVGEESRTDFTLTAKTTKIEVDKEIDDFRNKVRQTVIYAESEALTLADRPLKDDSDDLVLRPVQGTRIALDRLLGGVGGAVDALRARALAAMTLISSPEDIAISEGDEFEVLAVPTDAQPTWRLRTSDGVEGTVPDADASFLVFPAHEFVTGLRSGKSVIVCGKRLRATPATAPLDLVADDGAKRTIAAGESLLVLQRPSALESTGDVAAGAAKKFRHRLQTDDGFEGELEIARQQLDYLPAREDDDSVCELATVDTVRPVDGVTEIVITDALAQIYDRSTVVIQANVARATHGESKKDEVLGSGDGSATFSKFVLKNNPLTHIQAPSASGTATTLQVRVNKVLWSEVPHFLDSGPDDRVYFSRLADDGTVTVHFGDGITGARLPTGVENVTADYRKGIGLSGLLNAGQLKLLMTQALGVKGVVNPLAPGGAEDPESLDDSRANAPRTVLTLDRVVSLRDYEDFASAYAGISKALAAELWQGEQRVVHLTVAGVAGGDPPLDKLLAAIDAQRHPKARIIVQPYDAIRFGVKARVMADPAYVADDVLTAVEERLLESFSFDRRGFGQGISASEVIAAIQDVEGVVAVDLEKLDDRDPFDYPNVESDIAGWDTAGDGQARPAQLLTIDPDDIEILELT